jgi:hypothetical protein
MGYDASMGRGVVMMALAGLMLVAGAAMAQPASNDMVAADGFPLPLALPPPADTGKPRFFVAPSVAPPPSGCAASLDCRVRVIGEIQRNGAVELNATALRW